MIVLALETSTSRGGVALLKGPTLLALTEWERGKSHSELLTSAIETTLEQAKIKVDDVSAVAVDHGPGSFTGIRVGVNAARALGFSLHKPVVPLSSLEILAHGTMVPTSGKPLVCMLNAHKNLLYVARFEARGLSWSMANAPHVMSLPDLEMFLTETHLCVGDGFSIYESFFSSTLKSRLLRDLNLPDEPRALALGLLAQERLKGPSTFDWNQVNPLYLRASEAEEKLKK